MKHYRVTVLIESNDGKEFTYVGQRYFADAAHVKPWVDGFEHGAAAAHDGAVISTDIECLGDYMTLKNISKTNQLSTLRDD